MLRAATFALALTAMALLTVGTAAPQAPKADPKAKETPKTDPKGKDAPKAKDAESKYSLKSKAADIHLGSHISGPKLTADDLKGRVILLDYWGVNCGPCLAAMPATAALNAELEPFGLVVLGSHVQDSTPDKIRTTAAGRGANFAISSQTRVRDEEGAGTIPHCYVFDHTGTNTFRGMPGPAEAQVRTAVGNAIVAGAGKEKLAAPLQSVVNDLKAGKSPAALLAKVVALKGSGGETGADATALLESMTAVGRAKLKAAEEEKDAVAAFVLVEKVPALYKGTPVAAKATEMIAKLKKDKAVTAELAARTALLAVKKLEAPLVGTADDAKVGDYAKTHAAVLKPLKAKVAEMKKSWPDAPSTKEAVEIAERYGIDLGS